MWRLIDDEEEPKAILVTEESAEWERAPIQFPEWQAVLQKESLSEAQRHHFREAIVRFLRHCRSLHAPSTVVLIRSYLSGLNGKGVDREALRWFYQASGGKPLGLVRPATPAHIEDADFHKRPSLRSVVPPPAGSDLGGADWERDLIRAVRSKGFLWRTEETYRAWSARFAQFLRPRSPYHATAEDVGDFLTALAVKQRAMPSTQKQALNAVVFLLQEALKKEVGEIPFQRAFARRRVPTVLSRQEC